MAHVIIAFVLCWQPNGKTRMRLASISHTISDSFCVLNASFWAELIFDLLLPRSY